MLKAAGSSKKLKRDAGDESYVCRSVERLLRHHMNLKVTGAGLVGGHGFTRQTDRALSAWSEQLTAVRSEFSRRKETEWRSYLAPSQPGRYYKKMRGSPAYWQCAARLTNCWSCLASQRRFKKLTKPRRCHLIEGSGCMRLGWDCCWGEGAIACSTGGGCGTFRWRTSG